MYFITKRPVDELLTLTASEEVVTFEVTNLQDPKSTSRWRSTSVTPFIVGQFSTAIAIDFWGLWYNNAQFGDQAQLRVADTELELTSGPLLDTGFENVWPGTGDLSDWDFAHQRSTVDNPVSASWFRIDFDFTGNTDGFVQGGVLFAAERATPVISNRPRWRVFPRPRAVHSSLSADGGLIKGGGTLKRRVIFSFNGLSNDDMYGLVDPILRDREEVNTVGVVLVPDEQIYPTNFMFYGYLIPRSVIHHHNSRIEASFELVET